MTTDPDVDERWHPGQILEPGHPCPTGRRSRPVGRPTPGGPQVSHNDERNVLVSRSTLFEIGRDITVGNLSAACQTIIDILHADPAAAEKTDVDAEPAAEVPEERCPSCLHPMTYHRAEGCWFTVTRGQRGRDHVCPCDNGPVQVAERPQP